MFKMLKDLTKLLEMDLESIQVYALVQDLPILSSNKKAHFARVVFNSARILNRPVTEAEAVLISGKYLGKKEESGRCSSVEDPQKRWICYKERVMKDWHHKCHQWLE